MASKVGEYERKLVEMQYQLKENNAYMQDCFQDLESWTKDIREKEKKVLENPELIKNSNKGLPPIRNLVAPKKKKKKLKKDKSSSQATKKLSSYDYRAWDKLDVDKMCQQIDEAKSSSSEYTTDEEWEEEQRKVRADWEKERGNQFFKDNMLNEAINCYTSAIQLDPINAVYPANRAMCLIKQEKYAAAEVDCTTSIELDSKYTKAYHRRATARFKLGKFEEARKDYEMVLKLEPSSKLAQSELGKLEQLIESRNLVFPVCKREEEKSKKALKRILIEEINDESVEKDQVKKNLEQINQKIVLTPKDESLFSLGGKEEDKIAEKVDKIELEEKNEIKIERKAIPDAPSNGYQLKKDWQLLNNSMEDLATYFKKIKPQEYPKLFLNGLESDQLSKILLIFSEYFIKDPTIDLFDYLKFLSQVKRFNTQLMFLTSVDKSAINNLMCHIECDKEKYDKIEFEKLAKAYKI
ncbi:RNA polymerase II-associated 3-like [Brachionus plicatilis]|uniref:RNA polymerase II-associated protein 3 n=1 Tax=Brachionus plicatilis TaxID=10195 RepID=A0A3M7RLI5_BRAPC|nr:RNA polymerase II-associated 3-like [Brachionus plicatilis]